MRIMYRHKKKDKERIHIEKPVTFEKIKDGIEKELRIKDPVILQTVGHEPGQKRHNVMFTALSNEIYIYM